jgi:hypothetical protein
MGQLLDSLGWRVGGDGGFGEGRLLDSLGWRVGGDGGSCRRRISVRGEIESFVLAIDCHLDLGLFSSLIGFRAISSALHRDLILSLLLEATDDETFFKSLYNFSYS